MTTTSISSLSSTTITTITTTNTNSSKSSTNLPQLVLSVTGSWGRWQCQFFVFFLLTAVCSCWHSLQLTFLAPTVEYRCEDPSQSNHTGDQCIVNGVKCTRWHYNVGHNDSFYHRTIISEWNLVCDHKWLVSFTQSVYMFGTLMAVFGMAHCSDRFGRRPTIAVGWILQLGGTVSCALSVSMIQFLLSRWVLAFGMGTTWSVGFVLLLEIVGPEYREIVGLSVQLGWAAGYLTLPGLAYLTRDFRHILFACAALQLVQAFLYFALPESPRWLLANDRFDQARQVLTNAGRLNRREHLVADVDREIMLLKEQALMKHPSSVSSDKTYTVLNLFGQWSLARMTLMIFFIWFATALTYYGLSLNTNDLNGNPFVNFFLLGAVEIPAYLTCMFVVKVFGHRRTLVTTMVGAGLGCFAAISIDYNYYAGIIFAMAGKFCVTASFATIYVYSGQIYPTVMRTIGLGSSSTVARVGSILAPFISNLSEATNIAVSMVLLGSLSVVAAFLILFLKEPRGVEMPDKPEDIEHCD